MKGWRGRWRNEGVLGEAHSGDGIFAFKLGNVLSLGVPNSAPDTGSDTKQVLKEYLWPIPLTYCVTSSHSGPQCPHENKLLRTPSS